MGDENIIVVPKLSTLGLNRRAREKLDLTFSRLDYYPGLNIIRDEVGKRFEVLTHSFDHIVQTEEVLKFFSKKGFLGSSTAFMVWLIKNKPKGRFASIPDGERTLYTSSGPPCLLTFDNFTRTRSLDLRSVGPAWSARKGLRSWTFVAFREIK